LWLTVVLRSRASALACLPVFFTVLDERQFAQHLPQSAPEPLPLLLPPAGVGHVSRQLGVRLAEARLQLHRPSLQPGGMLDELLDLPLKGGHLIHVRQHPFSKNDAPHSSPLTRLYSR